MTTETTHQVDARGLACPMPIVKTAQAIATLGSGELLEVLATDPGSTKDFVAWESSPRNPVLRYSIEDKFIANPKITAEERERIAKAVNINNSDVDFCEFEGRTVIYYSWGNQQGIEHLAEAVYDGPESEFLKSFFPD